MPVCPMNIAKAGQETCTQHLKVDGYILLNSLSIFLDVNYDSNNMLFVKKKRHDFWHLVGEDLKRF